MTQSHDRPVDTTLGELRASGWRRRSVKEEMRANLLAHLREGRAFLPGILGYDETVLPQLENAILAGQDVILLGERGQAKSRIARSLVGLLDPWLPYSPAPSFTTTHSTRSRRWRARSSPRGRLDAIALVGGGGSVQREAQHAGHQHRRSHRRGGPGQGGRGPLPVRRADDPLRAAASYASGHLQPQRAAGPGRAHPGRAAQRDGGARRPGARLPGPAGA